MMDQRKEMSSGSSYHPGAAGRDAEPFFRAVRARIEYARRVTKSSGRAILVHDGVRQVCAGHLLPSGTFEKRLKSSHILRAPRSIAVQQEAVEELRRSGCHTVRAELPDGVTLEAPLDSFFRRGIKLNRGYGLQVALPLGWWRDTAAREQGRLVL